MLASRSGNRACSAASFLKREGYQVSFLDGGLEDWSAGKETLLIGASSA